jgi:hypothetical protein
MFSDERFALRFFSRMYRKRGNGPDMPKRHARRM